MLIHQPARLAQAKPEWPGPGRAGGAWVQLETSAYATWTIWILDRPDIGFFSDIGTPDIRIFRIHLESWRPDMNGYIVIWRHMTSYDSIWFDHISYESIWRHMTVYLLPRTSRFVILQRIVQMFEHACSNLPYTLHRILPSKVKKPMCRPCIRKIRISWYILV